jgi:4-hydroxy-3-methylbut-2-enyl diphosphate reductase
LIAELHKYGCEVYYSSFSTAMLDKFHKEWVSDHPEVRGLISYAAGPSHIFSTPAELDALLGKESFAGRAVVLAAQTTQDRLIFDEMHSELLARFGESLTVLDTICDATRQRQEEAGELAGQVQAMVVVGGKTSGNTRRLAELARMRGVPTVLVETADELDRNFFENVETVGLTAGASTPGYIIDEVEARLRSW